MYFRLHDMHPLRYSIIVKNSDSLTYLMIEHNEIINWSNETEII